MHWALVMHDSSGYHGTMRSENDTNASTNKNRRWRSTGLADLLDTAGVNPAEALVRRAAEAEARGDLPLAVSTWKALLPYRFPKTKPIESDPDGVIELARRMKEVGLMPDDRDNPYSVRLRRAMEALESAAVVVHQNTPKL